MLIHGDNITLYCNRMLAKISECFRVGLDYVNWFQELPSGEDYFNRKILNLNLSHRFNLASK